jgi:hypothetical protein
MATEVCAIKKGVLASGSKSGREREGTRGATHGDRTHPRHGAARRIETKPQIEPLEGGGPAKPNCSKPTAASGCAAAGRGRRGRQR